MKRLTQRTVQGNVYIPECFSRCNGMGCSEKCNDCKVQDSLINTLADYEDTNLLPEKITEIDKLYLERCKEVNRLNAELAELKKQPQGDLISRSELIKWLKKVTVTDGITFETGFKQILTDIENQPTVYNNGWIPCSERLPELNEELFSDDLLVSFEDSNDLKVAFYDGNKKKWYLRSSAPYIGKVIAWRELPAPYQPKGE